MANSNDDHRRNCPIHFGLRGRTESRTANNLLSGFLLLAKLTNDGASNQFG